MKPSPYPADWKEISAAIKKRDGYRCLAHKILGGTPCAVYCPPPFSHLLHVHHIIPLDWKKSAAENSLLNTPRNLITLCSRCHLNRVHHKPYEVKRMTYKQKSAIRRFSCQT